MGFEFWPAKRIFRWRRICDRWSLKTERRLNSRILAKTWLRSIDKRLKQGRFTHSFSSISIWRIAKAFLWLRRFENTKRKPQLNARNPYFWTFFTSSHSHLWPIQINLSYNIMDLVHRIWLFFWIGYAQVYHWIHADWSAVSRDSGKEIEGRIQYDNWQLALLRIHRSNYSENWTFIRIEINCLNSIHIYVSGIKNLEVNWILLLSIVAWIGA